MVPPTGFLATTPRCLMSSPTAGNQTYPACGFCHYPNGKGRPNNARPCRSAAGYILQQLEDFKDGARKSWDPRKRNTAQMIAIAKGLNDEDKHAAAEYFASMKWTPWVKVVETDTVPKAKFVGGGGGLNMPLEGPEVGKEPLGQRIVEVPASPGRHRASA